MKNIAILLALLFVASPTFVMAHGGGHSHETISSAEAKLRAFEKVNQLSKAGKIDSSWAGIKPSSIEQKAPDFALEWVVVFINTKVSDASKQTLYLFFSLDGDFIDSNFDGGNGL